MERPAKTVEDAQFARSVLNDHERLQQLGDRLNQAENAGVRELLGFMDVLRPLVKDIRFNKEAAERIGTFRDKSKAWILAISAAIGLAIALFTAYKTLWG